MPSGTSMQRDGHLSPAGTCPFMLKKEKDPGTWNTDGFAAFGQPFFELHARPPEAQELSASSGPGKAFSQGSRKVTQARPRARTWLGKPCPVGRTAEVGVLGPGADRARTGRGAKQTGGAKAQARCAPREGAADLAVTCRNPGGQGPAPDACILPPADVFGGSAGGS